MRQPCGSLAVVRDGRYRRTHDRIYRCKHCGARCILGRSDLYRMRNHSHAVSLAVELYSRGGLSFRTVAAILLKYLGVKVSHGAAAFSPEPPMTEKTRAEAHNI